MPNDAKFGMVVGVGLVILVSVVFFRRDTTAADAPATIPKSAPAVTQPPPAGQSGGVAVPGRRHVVQDGDTLMGLATRYYGSTEKFNLIYQANREQMPSPDRLKPGTVLVIPDALTN